MQDMGLIEPLIDSLWVDNEQELILSSLKGIYAFLYWGQQIKEQNKMEYNTFVRFCEMKNLRIKLENMLINNNNNEEIDKLAVQLYSELYDLDYSNQQSGEEDDDQQDEQNQEN